jgi:hypothetical protein
MYRAVLSASTFSDPCFGIKKIFTIYISLMAFEALSKHSSQECSWGVFIWLWSWMV